MLQASEYNVRDFLKWCVRTRDFRQVEIRKAIVWSQKARLLYTIGWCVSAAFILEALLNFFLTVWWLAAIGAIALMIMNAFVLPYALSLAVFLGQLVQRPLERTRVATAQKKLRAHSGLRVAIAGSYGKTSMREILKTVLSAGKKAAAAPGSYNTPLGIATFIDTLGGDEEVLIFELGEYYPGDVKKLCEFVEPEWGIITGVNEAHLEKFGSLERTAATIFELSEYLDGKPLYVNEENDVSKVHAPQEAIAYSRERVGEWRIENARTDLSGTKFTMRNGAIVVSVSSKLLGMHMIGPLAAAVHMGLALGLTVAQVEEGASRTCAFEHRLEPKTDGSGVVTLDDSYNGNPDGVAAVIDFLASLQGRRFYVTPGLVEMGPRTEEVHRTIGTRLAAAHIEQVVLIRNSVTPFIEKGLTDAGYSGVVTWFDHALLAYAALPHMTVSGDVVLLQNDWPDQYC